MKSWNGHKMMKTKIGRTIDEKVKEKQVESHIQKRDGDEKWNWM